MKFKSLSLCLLVFLFFTSLVYADGISNAGNTAYTTMLVSTDTGVAVYSDSANEDVGLVLCGQGSSKYVGAVYGANVSGTFYPVLITYDNTNGVPLSAAATNASGVFGAGCYRTSNSQLMFPETAFMSYAIPVYKPAFPGNIYLRYADDNSGTNSKYVRVDSADGWLSGSYTSVLSNMDFDEVTRTVELDFSQISYTGVGNKAKTDTNYGFDNTNENKAMVLAFCTDQYGADCADAEIVNNSGDLPVTLSSGLSAPQVVDTNKFDRYGVINGIGTAFCIGPELDVVSVSVNESSILSGNGYKVTVSFDNDGNVNVTTDFEITVVEKKGGVATGFTHVETITAEVGSTAQTFNFDRSPTSGSGSYTYEAIINDTEAGIATCGSTHPSESSSAVTVENVVEPQIRINGVLHGNFSYAGIINNVTIQLQDADGNAASYFANWTVEITETNGYNLFAPLQYENDSNGFSGAGSVITADLLLDGSGYGEFTLSPTGELAFNYLNDSSSGLYGDNFVDYSLKFKVYDRNGTEQNVNYQGAVYDCGVDCAVPFVFTNSDTFNLSTSDALHNIVTRDSAQLGNVWNKLRQVALSLVNLMQ